MTCSRIASRTERSAASSCAASPIGPGDLDRKRASSSAPAGSACGTRFTTSRSTERPISFSIVSQRLNVSHKTRRSGSVTTTMEACRGDTSSSSSLAQRSCTGPRPVSSRPCRATLSHATLCPVAGMSNTTRLPGCSSTTCRANSNTPSSRMAGAARIRGRIAKLSRATLASIVDPNTDAAAFTTARLGSMTTHSRPLGRLRRRRRPLAPSPNST